MWKKVTYNAAGPHHSVLQDQENYISFSVFAFCQLKHSDTNSSSPETGIIDSSDFQGSTNTGCSKMLDIHSIRNNVFDKRDMEMGFAVKCSSSLEVSTHII